MESQPDFGSARKITMVGRESYLLAVETQLHNPGLNLLYLEGDGGIGKTFLLSNLLERLPVDEFYPARTIIDLYHLDAQSPEGFARRALACFDQSLFPKTQTLLTQLGRARQEGNDNRVQEYLQCLDDCFLDDINALSSTRPVVLALDTLEVLAYIDEEQTHVTVLDIGNWLLHDLFPKIQGDVIVLMAGRSSIWRQQLDILVQEYPHIKIGIFTVSALSEADSKRYLETIIAEYPDPDATARLQVFCEEQGEVLLHLTQGKPILLSLVSDLVAQGWVLPQVFSEPLETLRTFSSEQLQEQVHRALFNRLQASPSPIGETMRQLAWLRKGATPELLARLLGLKTQQGNWDITMATEYLNEARTLTFVKVRSDDERVFLHDELYTLFDHHALPYFSPDELARVYSVIETYYSDQINISSSSYVTMPRADAQLQQLHLERMHYLLRQQPASGYDEYCRLIEGAVGERDWTFEMMLRSELVRTAILPEIVRSSNAAEFQRQIQVDFLVRKGARALFQRLPQLEMALQCFEQALQQASEMELEGIYARLHQAIVYILRGHGEDYRVARKILEGIVEVDELYLSTDSINYNTRQLLRALSFNYSGYLNRLEGRYQEAIKAYQASVMWQRRLGMVGLAPTLINLAYVQAYLGLLHEADLSLDEAEHRIQKKQQLSTLVRVLNTRAFVESQGNNHTKALALTERALKHCDSISTAFVGQIYLTRALIYRKIWDSEDETYKGNLALSLCDDTLEIAFNAAKEIDKALQFLLKDEMAYQEALTQKAKIYRNIAREMLWRKKYIELDMALRESRKSLEEALEIARDVLRSPVRQAYTLNAKAWIHYFMGEDIEAEKTLVTVYSLIPMNHQLRDNLEPAITSKDSPYAPYWEILARIEMLQCHLSLNQAQKCRQAEEEFDKCIQRAVEHATRAFTYNALIADKYPDIERSETGLYKRILRQDLSIEKIYRYAWDYARKSVSKSTRLLDFLERMFGPAELWL